MNRPSPRCLISQVVVFVVFCVSATGLTAGSVDYAYDAAGRLVSSTYPGVGVVTYTLDAPGNRKSVTSPVSSASNKVVASQAQVASSTPVFEPVVGSRLLTQVAQIR
jgi:YD repeat-containing protein